MSDIKYFMKYRNRKMENSKSFFDTLMYFKFLILSAFESKTPLRVFKNSFKSKTIIFCTSNLSETEQLHFPKNRKLIDIYQRYQSIYGKNLTIFYQK